MAVSRGSSPKHKTLAVSRHTPVVFGPKVSIHELEETRINLIQLMPKILTKEEKNFIFSIYQSNPRWELLGLKNIEKLPAVRWKLLNVNKMSDEKRRKEVDQISEILEQT